MSSTISLTQDSALIARQASLLRRIARWLRHHPVVLAALLIVAFWVVGALIIPLIANYDPLAQNLDLSLTPPDAGHVWGTDKLGRDILTRVIYGGRLTLPAGFFGVFGSLMIGMLVGSVAGYVGGLWDEAIMRVTDVFLAFPTIILAMAIAAALGPSINNAIITIAVVSWPGFARLTRGMVMSIKTADYVEASRAIGASHFHILVRTILPNSLGPLVVMATLDFGNAVLIVAGLSFLGLGSSPETPEWGRMVADGIEYADQWWVSVFPGLAIFSVVMALNFIGDGLRDILDPRTRRR